MESPLPLLILLCLLLVLLLSPPALGGTHLHLPSDRGQSDSGDGSTFTRWAVLVAGSNGFENYRHQADVCHAYQVLKRGGLKDENIIVFMYDDIAHHKDNPRPGVIINHPDGEDVYGGVPKDYVGDDVNVANFFAVLLGNKTALTGGSGKVVDSGPEDHIFIYYSDHGGPGVLGMPTNPNLYAVDLIEVLKMKHASGSYKSMVIYIEACESGSIFEGILPQGLNIYATTAANAVESSWGTYCPGDLPTPLPGFYSCLGDLYSVAWMEDSDSHNLQTETLRQQYHLVQARTAVHNTYDHGSHVMQFGDLQLSMNHIFSYIGSNPANENFTYPDDNALPSSSKAVNQRDADLLYFWNKYRHSADGSSGKWEAQRQLYDAMAHRLHLDNSLDLIGKLLFGSEQGPKVMNTIRPAGQPLADDWSCLKSLVRTFENHCGSLSQYGMKHMRSIANICNAGIHEETMGEVASQACRRIPSGHWGSLHRGFSA